MTAQQELEALIRQDPRGYHSDARRTIMDVPAGYAFGRPIATANVIAVGAEPPVNLDDRGRIGLGQHYHTTFAEVFALVRGRGDLLVEAMDTPTSAFNKSLVGTKHTIPVDSADKRLTFVYLPKGVAHTFLLEPNSILLAYTTDAPQNFNPGDPANNNPHSLIALTK